MKRTVSTWALCSVEYSLSKIHSQNDYAYRNWYRGGHCTEYPTKVRLGPSFFATSWQMTQFCDRIQLSSHESYMNINIYFIFDFTCYFQHVHLQCFHENIRSLIRTSWYLVLPRTKNFLIHIPAKNSYQCSSFSTNFLTFNMINSAINWLSTDYFIIFQHHLPKEINSFG